jgi:hypothetical protein
VKKSAVSHAWKTAEGVMGIEALPFLLLTLDVVRPARTAPGFDNFRVLFEG